MFEEHNSVKNTKGVFFQIHRYLLNFTNPIFGSKRASRHRISSGGLKKQRFSFAFKELADDKKQKLSYPDYFVKHITTLSHSSDHVQNKKLFNASLLNSIWEKKKTLQTTKQTTVASLFVVQE